MPTIALSRIVERQEGDCGKCGPLQLAHFAKAPVTYDQPQSYGQPFEYRPPQQSSGYGYPGQPNAIKTQGNVSYVSPNTVTVTSGVHPPYGMVLALLACAFCFWPTGVFAIMYASQSNTELNNNMAWSKYRTSRTLSIVSIIVGLIWIGSSIGGLWLR